MNSANTPTGTTSYLDNVSDVAPEGFAERLTATKATLKRIASEFAPAVFASSLAAEDMVLTDLIFRDHPQIGIFSLETGRLPAATMDVVEKIKQNYGQAIALYYPQTAAVAEFVKNKGLNAFYDSVELRKECCHIRKVEPLGRALKGNKSWVTGQRRAQSTTRASLDVQEQDEAHDMTKFNPLADWSEQDVWYYIKQNEVPYNSLHDKGYPSIGCDPCTRAIQPGEDVRAGRWWWENPESKECGLHVVDGKLVRINK